MMLLSVTAPFDEISRPLLLLSLNTLVPVAFTPAVAEIPAPVLPLLITIMLLSVTTPSVFTPNPPLVLPSIVLVPLKVIAVEPVRLIPTLFPLAVTSLSVILLLAMTLRPVPVFPLNVPRVMDTVPLSTELFRFAPAALPVVLVLDVTSFRMMLPVVVICSPSLPVLTPLIVILLIVIGAFQPV